MHAIWKPFHTTALLLYHALEKHKFNIHVHVQAYRGLILLGREKNSCVRNNVKDPTLLILSFSTRPYPTDKFSFTKTCSRLVCFKNGFVENSSVIKLVWWLHQAFKTISNSSPCSTFHANDVSFCHDNKLEYIGTTTTVHKPIRLPYNNKETNTWEGLSLSLGWDLRRELNPSRGSPCVPFDTLPMTKSML